ncbi:unnamed protein product [Chrysoparadoxa australica]
MRLRRRGEALKSTVNMCFNDEQELEKEALEAIYEEKFTARGDTWLITISPLVLSFRLSPTYPHSPPASVKVSSPKLHQETLRQLEKSLVFEPGEVCGFKWAEQLKGLLEETAEVDGGVDVSHGIEEVEEVEEEKVQHHQEAGDEVREDEEVTIVSGEPFTIKKSTFQAHVAEVRSEEEVGIVMRQLLSNGKIQRATHNIMAYRILLETSEGPRALRDNDDDGEQAAGGRLAELLHVMQVENCVVVVSRWFGGTLLGPDRFKHINNVARELLHAAGFASRGASKGRGRRKA